MARANSFTLTSSWSLARSLTRLAVLELIFALNACSDGSATQARFSISLDREFSAATDTSNTVSATSTTPGLEGNSSTDTLPSQPGGGTGTASTGGSGFSRGDSLSGVSIGFGLSPVYQVSRIAGSPVVGNDVGNQPFEARLGSPAGIVLTSTGDLIVCDRVHNQIRMYPSSEMPTIIAGDRGGESGYLGENLTASSSRLSGPTGLVRDERSDAIYFCDSGNNRIRFFTPGGRMYTATGGGPDTSDLVAHPLQVRLDEPQGLAFDAEGRLYFTEKGAGRLRELLPDGQVATITHSNGGAMGPIAVSRDGRSIWVGESSALKLIRRDSTGDVASMVLRAFPGQITSLAYNQVDMLYVAFSSQTTPVGESGQITAIPVAADGRLDTLRDPLTICGTGLRPINDLDYSVPIDAIADARAQPIAAAARCSLYIDLRAASSPTKQAGDVYFGNGFDANGIRWGEVARLRLTGVE